jgi:hypothetical protein
VLQHDYGVLRADRLVQCESSKMVSVTDGGLMWFQYHVALLL